VLPKKVDILSDSVLIVHNIHVQALSVLGETGWKINKRVLEVVEKLWVAGGGIADLVEAADVSFCCSVKPSIPCF